ncbi:MAG: AMP-binding protein [Sphingobacteriales bacterium]|nr:AMP-binding protein [Sphingobacteriales bacterium]
MESIIQSGKVLGDVVPNIATMLATNAGRWSDKIVFQWKQDGKYTGINWNGFYNNILNIAFNLKKFGFSRGDKLVIFSPNRLEMLELELAVMASGGVAVPIFAFFHQETAELLINHSDAKFLAVAGELQLSRVSDIEVKDVFVFDKAEKKYFPNQHSFDELLTERSDKNFSLYLNEAPEEICLNMYTSGTMGIPKCVQLSHKNILSQQAGLSLVWNLDLSDRFLSYLPWHHSFGGIFELFAALYNGATYSLDSGLGKDPSVILENWKLIQPTVFFSVPKVYQMLVDLTRHDKEAEDLFFHSQLKFIFTAAAALPQKLSDEFEKRHIPVVEGWGLTETSPCCTLTDPLQKREPGVVGFPLPGVSLRLADDGEILVKGPNVMKGYYKNDEANKGIFTEDDWFCTGDVGEMTEKGLKLITRKDRIFKLSNGEKVVPSDLEKLIELKCHYISFAMVVGNGEEYPVALLFPNKKLLEIPDYALSPNEGCFCPRNLNELSRCLRGCLHDANCGIGQKFAKIKSAMIINDELTLEKGTLTPSMKVAPKNVVKAYKAHLENLYGAKNLVDNEVYVIRLSETEDSLGKIITV